MTKSLVAVHINGITLFDNTHSNDIRGAVPGNYIWTGSEWLEFGQDGRLWGMDGRVCETCGRPYAVCFCDELLIDYDATVADSCGRGGW